MFMLLSISCKKDDHKNGSFELVDAPDKMEVTAEGIASTYTFKASGKWNIGKVPQADWVKISPEDGSGDGTFTVTIARNRTLEARATTLVFTVDGQLQNKVFKIEQAAAEVQKSGDPFLYFDGTPSGLEVAEAGGTSNYIVRALGRWRLELEDQPEWATVEPMEGNGDTPVKIIVSKNTDLERFASLLFFLEDEQQPVEFPIHQKGQKLQVSGDVVLKEDFSWLSYGSEVFNVTDGETRIGSWTTAEIAKGWTSTIPPDATIGSTYASLYARPGFVKLGRTNYGADLVSPKLENVQRTKDLLVTFKAVRYATSDHYLLTVGVNGPGTVSVKEFDIMNLANPNSNIDACRAAWKAHEATYSFVVTGATSETQVWFMGGAFDQRTGNWPKTTNRIFIDDVVVTVK
ncbi:hypothetical protein M472_11640 [Sphingobacterium paucimobilis HER1398]|uniref:BACON domain-containing protein n=2 Tax=Sphingobacterium TaxID=28453 RepID=U2HV64_9SPHI|nr:hypothetical protein M472_11640 [Sphingobacterium paucimobilis HER1398]